MWKKTFYTKSLTLWFQLVNDGCGSGQGHGGDGADTLLRSLTHTPDVWVVFFGVTVHAGHQAVRGAHQREIGNPLHHIL